MSAREGHENVVLCPDGKERKFRSKLEESFMEYCDMEKWEITDYGEISYEIIPNVFETQEKEGRLESILYNSGVFFEVGKMRKPERAVYTPDFHIKIDGELWVVEVKAYYKNSDLKGRSKQDVENNIAYQLRKTMFLSKYECNFLEVSTDKSGKYLSCLYYKSTGKEKLKIV